MNEIEKFEAERAQRIADFAENPRLQALSREWTEVSMREKYVYNFSWLGRPIIQYPQDMVAVQELIWAVKPDLIIETGVAHGGSLVLSASMLALIEMSEAIEKKSALDVMAPRRRVLGIDIDIRAHNRQAIEAHPMANRIALLQGSSVDPDLVKKVRDIAAEHQRVMVFLDSMHTHDHVLAELDAYADLVSAGSYCVVFDTFVDDMPAGFFADRPWDVGNNPKTAVRKWLEERGDFEVDVSMENKLQVTVAPHGFLRRRA